MIIIKGKLIPIDTETNPDMISLATSNSEAYALPMRPKEEVSNLTTLFNDDSKPSLPRSSILDQSRRPRNGFKYRRLVF